MARPLPWVNTKLLMKVMIEIFGVGKTTFIGIKDISVKLMEVLFKRENAASSRSAAR